MYKMIKNKGITVYSVNEYVCDDDSDVSSLPLGAEMGSAAFVINSGKSYIKGSNDWVNISTVNNVSVNLTPVDGSLIIQDDKIDIGISKEPNNALTKKEDGLYVSIGGTGNYDAGLGLQIIDNVFSVKLAEEAHGLTAVNGALTLQLATEVSSGAMSQEDKIFLNELKKEFSVSDAAEIKQSIVQLKETLTWAEM